MDTRRSLVYLTETLSTITSIKIKETSSLNKSAYQDYNPNKDLFKLQTGVFKFKIW